MSEEKENVQSSTWPYQSNRLGVLRIDAAMLHEMQPAITIDALDTLGQLRDRGVFDALHKQFFLPGSYEIRAVFCESFARQWAIVIESPDFPEVDQASVPPDIEPHYTKTLDGVYLSGVEIRTNQYVRAPNWRQIVKGAL